MHNMSREERRLCVKLAYGLMLLARRKPHTFAALARAIVDRAPEVHRGCGAQMLRDLLIVSGGRSPSRL